MSQTNSVTYINMTITTLLNAATSAARYEANGHPGYIETSLQNLIAAQDTLNAAIEDARERVGKVDPEREGHI